MFKVAALALVAVAGTVSGHGILTQPVSRALRSATNATNGFPYAGTCPDGACEWYTQWTVIPGNKTNCDPKFRTMGVNCDSKNPIDYPCYPGKAVPWCAPGTAPAKSPCGVFAGGFNFSGQDMLELDRTPQTTWKAGSKVPISFGITANHGGGYIYRLCPHTSEPTEACFNSHVLPFTGDTQKIIDATGKTVASVPAQRLSTGTYPAGSAWSRNPFPQEDNLGPKIPGLPNAFGRGPFHLNLQDMVEVPKTLTPGNYVLSWRWDAEQTKQVWSQCSDVTIEASDEPAAVAKPQKSQTTDMGAPCVGASIGLEEQDCKAWQDLYDMNGGANWPANWCSDRQSMRNDPCGCAGNWEIFVVCESFRSQSRINEIYVLSDKLQGKLPASFTNLTGLKSLSFVNTKLVGPLPSDIGNMENLQMVWLDHNPMLGGVLPMSMAKLPLTVLELHRSAFTGALPPLNYDSIYDCTLNDLNVSCPLPKGADSCGASCH